MGLTPGYGEKLITAPTWEPVSVAEMQAHARTLGLDDAQAGRLTLAITEAREYVEVLTRRQIPQAQYALTVDQFPGRQIDDFRPPGWRYGIVRMPRPPLISIDLVQYYGPEQGEMPLTYTTLATSEYQVDANSEPGRLAPAPFLVWPQTSPLAMAAVKVTFTCGWATANAVPARLKQAIKLVASHIYEHREEALEVALARIPLGVKAFASSAAPWEYS